MFSAKIKKTIISLALNNNFSAILGIIDNELQASGENSSLEEHAFLVDYLLKAAKEPALFTRAIQHLSNICSVNFIENINKYVSFREIFANPNNGITDAQKTNAVEVLLSSEQNHSIRLGLYILQTETFTLDFITTQLQKGMRDYPYKVLSVLCHHAANILTQKYFSVELQTLIQESATKAKSICKKVNDEGYEEYVERVKIVAGMLAVVIPTAAPNKFLKDAFNFCHKLLESDNKNHLFAVVFLKKIEESHPGIITESRLFISEPYLLTRFEILFALNTSDTVYGLSQIGLALLKKYAADEKVIKLFKEAVSELTDVELNTLARHVHSHNDIPSNVLECLNLDSQNPTADSNPIVKKLKFDPKTRPSHLEPLPSFEEVLYTAGINLK